MVMVHFRGPDEMAVSRVADAFAEALRPHLPPAVMVSGPLPSPITRIRTHYRYQMTLRGGNVRTVVALLRRQVVATRFPDNVDVHVDVDPRSLM